jgi:hypothetical protein
MGYVKQQAEGLGSAPFRQCGTHVTHVLRVCFTQGTHLSQDGTMSLREGGDGVVSQHVTETQTCIDYTST